MSKIPETMQRFISSKFILQQLVLLLLIFSFPFSVWSEEIAPPTALAPPEYAVQDLKATAYSDQTILVVAGKIRNLSERSLKGMVVIYLKNETNDIIGLIETELQAKAVSPGEQSDFEVTADISEIKGIKNVSVEVKENI